VEGRWRWRNVFPCTRLGRRIREPAASGIEITTTAACQHT